MVLGLGIFQCGEAPSEREPSSKEAVFAPSFILPDVGGRPVKFSEFQGKVILLNFWATWCGPCRTEIPHLNELHRAYEKEGLVIVGISLDYGKPELVRDFLKRNHVDFAVLMGNDEIVGTYSRIPGFGSMRGIPTTYLIDRRGRIVRKFLGATSQKKLEEAIRPLLKQEPENMI
jgi:peroxiredoxin